MSEKTGQTLRFERLNMNHFVRDDVYIVRDDVLHLRLGLQCPRQAVITIPSASARVAKHCHSGLSTLVRRA